MLVRLLLASGYNVLKSALLKICGFFLAATLGLVYKLLTGPPQKRKCFSDISG